MRTPLASPDGISTTKSSVFGSRALSFIVLVLLSLNLLKRNNQSCQTTTTPIARVASTSVYLKAQSDANQYNQYINPISDRVPAQGIEAILATSRTNPPFHFFAYDKSKDWLTEAIVKNGVYEPDSTTAMVNSMVCQYAKEKQQQENDKPLLVLDLGANIGFHSLHMASCGARVVSFEASPDTAWLLRSSARLNGFWKDHPSTLPGDSHSMTIIPRGASNATSVGRLSRHPKSPGMTSFAKGTPSEFNLQSGDTGTALDVDIPLVRAQDVFHSLDITPHKYDLRFLKMDVEGFELQALQGLDLQQFPFQYLTFEFFPALLKSAGTNPVDLLVYIWQQGYRYLDFNPQQTVDQYKATDTGGDTEQAVRAWGNRMVSEGMKKKGQGYHVNLLAKHSL